MAGILETVKTQKLGKTLPNLRTEKMKYLVNSSSFLIFSIPTKSIHQNIRNVLLMSTSNTKIKTQNKSLRIQKWKK
jgi:hypothetical protein